MKKTPHGLGRKQSEFDPRDYSLRDFIPRGAPLIPKTESSWDYVGEPLDQETTPHCVGFSIANFGINLPVHIAFTNEDGHKFYYRCKELDGKPNSEEGSTIKTAAKLLRESGRIEAYAFASSMDIIKYWLLNQGPLIVGTVWTNDMFVPDADNTVHVSKDGGVVDIVGGHAYLLNGLKDNRIRFQNSWGANWGLNGSAWISVTDFEKLFNYNGEAMAAVEIENYKKSKPCYLRDLFNTLRHN